MAAASRLARRSSFESDLVREPRSFALRASLRSTGSPTLAAPRLSSIAGARSLPPSVTWSQHASGSPTSSAVCAPPSQSGTAGQGKQFIAWMQAAASMPGFGEAATSLPWTREGLVEEIGQMDRQFKGVNITSQVCHALMSIAGAGVQTLAAIARISADRCSMTPRIIKTVSEPDFRAGRQTGPVMSCWWELRSL